MMARMLQNLSIILDKAAAHAAAMGIDPATMIESRLAPDMFNLARQVQSAADAAKACVARLSGEAPPSHPDTETSFYELKGSHRQSDRLCREHHPGTNQCWRGPEHYHPHAWRTACIRERRGVSDAIRHPEFLLPCHHGLNIWRILYYSKCGVMRRHGVYQNRLPTGIITNHL
jgi:hypothetical protein